MNGNLKSNKKFDYKKLIIFSSVGAGIAFALVLILGLLLDFIFYAVLFYAVIIVSFLGFCGGLWLWENLSTSKLIMGVKSAIKRAYLLISIGLAIGISFCVYTVLNCDLTCLKQIIVIWEYLLLFLLCYMGGVIYSIWKPSSVSKANQTSSAEFPDWIFIKRVLKTFIKAVGLFSLVFLLGGILFGEIIAPLLMWGSLALCFFGFSLGYLVWEHLKKANVIEGKFQKQVKLINGIIPIVVGGLWGYSIWVNSIPAIHLFRELILYYSIFLSGVVFFSIGLCVAIIKSE